MKSAASWLVGHARLVLLIHLLVTILLATFAWRLRIEGSLQSVLPAGDPAVQYYADVRATFGSDDVAVVGVLADDLFSASTLTKIARVTDKLSRLDGVERVLSLTNAVDYAADVFDPPPLLPDIPPNPSEVALLRTKISSTPLYANNFVSHDFKGAAINVFLKDLTDTEYRDLGIDEKIQDALAAEAGPEEFFYTGAAHVKKAAVTLMSRDLFRLTPVALAFAIVVLWLAFRSLRGVLLPMVSVIEATIWTLGVMVLLGKSINLGTFILPPLLLVIGTSYGIHVMARYDELHGSGTTPDVLVVETIDRVWLPLLISAMTTVIGFGALMLNRITAIWDLGFFSVIGLVFLFITSLTLLPAALQVLGPRVGGTRPVNAQSPRLSRALSILAARSYSSRYLVLALSTVFGLVVALGMRSIRVDSDFLSYFEADSPVRLANETINQKIVGSNPFYLVVDGGKPDSLKRWEVLKQIKDLEAFLQTLPGITSSISIVDYLELLETGLNQEGEDDLVIDEQGRIVEPGDQKTFWEDPSKLAGVLSLLSTAPNAFRGAVTADFSRGNILVRTKLSGSREIEKTLFHIRQYIDEHLPAGLSIKPTGNLVLLTGTSSDIVAGQIRSLSLALVVIFIVMSLMFLSVRVGLLAILPNVLPLVIFFGVLGWCGIDFNLGTSLIATIALGIAVDSTIHYMSRLSRELEGETDQTAAMRRTLQNVGLPIIYTALALLFGFLTLTASNFVPIQSFGLMAAVTLATALAANLLVLPSLLSTTKIITLWDLLSVKLGRDPSRTIPMLAGLRPAQSRIVVLMGEMRKFDTGEMIVRRGELGEDMFVIIQGNVSVWAGEGDERRRVSELGRGDVFGEMALVRHNERSADVVADGEVEVLAVNERFLERIQRRYPRIASKVFLNLTRILSDRLERMTDQLVGLR
jgi:hypothetical protein